MKKLIILCSVMLVGLGLGMFQYGYAERNCLPEMICVAPGDYLKFEIKDSSELYIEFGKSLDDDRIEYFERGSYDDGSPYEEHYILDKKTGDTFSFDNPYETFSSLLTTISVIPLERADLDPVDSVSCINTVYDYNGENRKVYSCSSVDEELNIKVIRDEKTGIVFYFEMNFKGELDGNEIFMDGLSKLIDTNIITTETQKVEEIPISEIPTWIKNNAKWWAEDQIDDNTFVNGIQFLINSEIIHVSGNNSDTSSESIPAWIKNTAGWWADGMIGDGDFLKGIEYLVNEGIIRS